MSLVDYSFGLCVQISLDGAYMAEIVRGRAPGPLMGSAG
jgi:hypothetical protein